MDVGALTPPLWGFEEREKLMVFYERASGSRMHAAYFRVGGVHQDLPPKLIDDIEAFCDPFLKVCDDLEDLLTGNRIFKQRNVDIGVVSLKDAWAWGFSGVMVRGSGAAWDLRKAQPYECYSELDFDIPIGKNGDCYDRYLHPHGGDAAVDPHHEAVHRQAARAGRAGARSASLDNKIVPPRRGEMKRSMEALIHHFKLYTEGFHVPAGEVYAAVEAPKGEFGVYLVSDGTNKPYKLQDPRAGLRASAGDGFPLPRPHAGRRLGGPRLARHRVRGGRPVMALPPISYDRATGRLEGATAMERCAALAFAAGAKASAPMHYRGFSIGCRVITSMIDQREIVVLLNDDARFAFPFGDGYWSLLLDRSFVYEGEIERFLRSIADVDYGFVDGGANFGFWSVLVSSRPFGSHPVIAIEASSANAAQACAQRRAQRRPLQGAAPRHRIDDRQPGLAQRRQARGLPRRRGERAPNAGESVEMIALDSLLDRAWCRRAAPCHQARCRGHGDRRGQGRQATPGKRNRHHRRGSWRGSRPHRVAVSA